MCLTLNVDYLSWEMGNDGVGDGYGNDGSSEDAVRQPYEHNKQGIFYFAPFIYHSLS